MQECIIDIIELDSENIKIEDLKIDNPTNNPTDTKKELGQFYTTNYNTIFKNINLDKKLLDHIIEPFAGNCHLIEYIINHVWENNLDIPQIELYDMDPCSSKYNIVVQNTIINPPSYKDKFIITNPPYLAKNKTKQHIAEYAKYDVDDLYKCFIKEIITNKCLGGLIIIPVNFWCSIRKKDIELRKQFIKNYKIHIMNIFENQVFDDTSYSVCSIYFEQSQSQSQNLCFPICIFNNAVSNSNPSKTISLDETHYLIGGEIYNLKKYTPSTILVSRLINIKTDYITNIIVKCIDDSEKINCSYVASDKIYYDNTQNSSARCYFTPNINPKLSEEGQKKLVEYFNSYLSEYRNKYNSLFLTNYREGNRKRISFELAYDILAFLIHIYKLN